MKNIFVTGATGALGPTLIKLFLEKTDCTFFVLSRRDSKETLKIFKVSDEQEKRINVVRGDLNSKIEFIPEIDTIIHMGGCTNLGDKCYEELFEANVVGTKNVVEFANDCDNLEHFIHFSTFFASEEYFPSIESHYVETKRQGLKYLRNNLCVDKTILTVVEPAIVIGNSKGGHMDICSTMCAYFNPVYKYMEKNSSGCGLVLPSLPKALFNIVHVDWVARVVLEVALKKPEKSISLSNHEPVVFGDIVSIAKEVFSKILKIDRVTISYGYPTKRSILKVLNSLREYTSSDITPKKDKFLIECGLLHKKISPEDLRKDFESYSKSHY